MFKHAKELLQKRLVSLRKMKRYTEKRPLDSIFTLEEIRQEIFEIEDELNLLRSWKIENQNING